MQGYPEEGTGTLRAGRVSILQSEALLEEKRQMAVIKDRPVGCDMPEMRRNVLGSAECGRNRNAHPGKQEGGHT